MYSPAATWPVKSNGRIFIAVPDRRLYVLDCSSGEEIKHFDACARESVGISPDGKRVYCKSMWHKIMSVDASSLDVEWQAETLGGYEISPTSIIQAGGEVIMPTDKGNLIGFDALTGERLWEYKIANALVNPMTIIKEGRGSWKILVCTMDGAVALLEKE